jgi:hypothetical protein
MQTACVRRVTLCSLFTLFTLFTVKLEGYMASRALLSRSTRTATWVVLPTVGSVVLAGLLATGPANADVTSVGGGAFGESVAVKLLAGNVPVNSGPMPQVTLPASGGGPFTNRLASATVPMLLSAGVLTVSTSSSRLGSHTSTANSSASTANVKLGSGQLTATVVKSSCTASGLGSTGSTTILGTNLPGLSVNPAPNTTIAVPGLGSVTFNEQIRSNSPGRSTSITVNAIHVRLTNTLAAGDIIISQSRCVAKGPDVLLTATPAPTSTPTTTPTTTPTAPPSQPGSGPGATGTPPAAGPATAQPGTARFTG